MDVETIGSMSRRIKEFASLHSSSFHFPKNLHTNFVKTFTYQIRNCPCSPDKSIVAFNTLLLQELNKEEKEKIVFSHIEVNDITNDSYC